MKMNKLTYVLCIAMITWMSCTSKSTKKAMTWENANNYYTATVKKDENKKEAIKSLMLKITELSKGKEAWNSIILDKWIFSLGRLIGNIQNANQSVGDDRGYRVALHFESYAQELENPSNEAKYDWLIDKYSKELETLIIEILNDDIFCKKLLKSSNLNSLIVEICEQGERNGLKFEIEQ